MLSKAARWRMALRGRRAGARYNLIIIDEAQRAGIPISLGYALIETESGFRNVFGHDPTIFVGAGEVTKDKYLAYKRQRGTRHMQGVGPAQLTWWATQDAADRLGGCWRPKYNIRVAFKTLADNIHTYGKVVGIERYNGTGPAAVRYSQIVRGRADKWHRILSP